MRAATQNPTPIEIFSWARLIQSVLEECCSVTSAFCPHRKEFDIKRSKEFVYKNNSFIERHIIFLPTDRLVGLWYCILCSTTIWWCSHPRSWTDRKTCNKVLNDKLPHFQLLCSTFWHLSWRLITKRTYFCSASEQLSPGSPIFHDYIGQQRQQKLQAQSIDTIENHFEGRGQKIKSDTSNCQAPSLPAWW